MDISVKIFLISTMLFSALSFAKESSYDFDHQLHYSQQKLSENNYKLIVKSRKQPYERATAFVTRKALDLCGKQGFQITYLDGVEYFEERKAMANKIFPSLKVQITCS